MRFKILFPLFLLIAAHLAALDPELAWLKPGMTGYGLTVFKGTIPEKFNVEIIGFIENAMPKQDLILIKCSGKNLEFSGVVAGMSGSPIYVDGKLIGALGYGWSFSKEPIAGVTPITSMQREINRSLAGRPDNITPRPALPEGIRRIETPMMVSGISNRTLQLTKDLLSEYGFEPLQAGGTVNTVPPSDRLYPGSALAVKLIKGDISFDAIGTVSYVDGDTIAAFGHPFFEFGVVNFPYSLAQIDYIFASLNRSFKFGTAFERDAGVIIGDRQACITGMANAAAEMIPVSITVANTESGYRDSFRTEVIKNQHLTYKLIIISLSEAINSSLNELNSNMVKVKLAIHLSGGKTITLDDRFYNDEGGFNYNILMFLMQAVSNPFADVTITGVEAAVEQMPGRSTARLIEVITLDRIVHPGDTCAFVLKLQQYNQPEIVSLPISLSLPADLILPNGIPLVVSFRAGKDVAPNRPFPFAADQYSDFINDFPKMDQVVAEIRIPREEIEYKGVTFKDLPAAYSKIIRQSDSNAGAVSGQTLSYRFDTPWIVQGSIATVIKIKNEVR